MKQPIAIINASPTILLVKTVLISKIPSLFSEVIIPQQVIDEIFIKEYEETIILKKMIREKLISTMTVENSAINLLVSKKSNRLGRGELAVIALAFSFQKLVDKLVIAIIDDKPARNLAKLLGIKCIGTLGILVLARKKAIITADESELILKKLIQFGGYFSPLLIERVKLELEKE